MLFVVSLLFLADRHTLNEDAGFARAMAHNLLRCDSEATSVVFINAQYDEEFVHTPLSLLRCNAIDPNLNHNHGLDTRQSSRSVRPKLAGYSGWVGWAVFLCIYDLLDGTSALAGYSFFAVHLKLVLCRSEVNCGFE